MEFIKSLFAPSIRRRITLAFAFITLLIIGLALETILQLNKVRPYSEAIARDTVLQKYSSGITSQLTALDGDLERYILFQSPEYQEKVRAEMQNIADALDNLHVNTDSTLEPILVEVEAVLSPLQEDVNRLLDESNTLSAGDVNRLTIRIYANLETLATQQQNLSNAIVERIHQSAQTQTEIAKRIQVQTLVVSILMGLTAIIAAVVTNFSLRNITRLTAVATAIAKGDLTQRATFQSRDELGTLATAFNTMAGEIQENVRTLEDRVAERTKALATSTEVSRRLSTILDADQLVKEVVEQLVSAFDYYYAHIYLFDDDPNTLVMKGGTGEAGQVLLARGHTIPKGRGLVGRAAERNEVVLVGDTLNEEGWLPNDLLPDTKSECAVPISIGDNVLGVFDVQHNLVNGITQEDADLLEGIANQVAIAVQNAQAFTRAQKQADREARIAKISKKIQQATTIDDVLKLSVNEISSTLDITRASVSVERKTKV